MAATLNRQLKNICVLSEFHYDKYKEFIVTGIDLDRVLIGRKINLVYGESE